MLPAPGDLAPSFTLDDAFTAEPVSDPWKDGPVVLAFFKVTCPVCQLTAPKVQALADAGVRVIGIGEDPPRALADYARRFGQKVPTLTEPPPYRVSDAFGLTTVPSLVLVGEDGAVVDAVGAWDREKWNALAVRAGGGPISRDSDGLPPFRPG